MLDVVVVALAGSPSRALRGVATLREPSAEVMRVKRDAELATNQLGHATGRPEIGGETVRRRLLRQPAPDLLILFGGQKARATGRWFGRQTGLAFGPMPSQPFGDRHRMNPETARRRNLGLSTQNRLNSTPTNNEEESMVRAPLQGLDAVPAALLAEHAP